jgi:hypothetical protein
MAENNINKKLNYMVNKNVNWFIHLFTNNSLFEWIKLDLI